VNRLAAETSPYLLQHADNPVDWQPWGDEAFARARAEDKPVLLSVGYSSCHWCHVMAHESFESPSTAAIMNEHFINVKVDREERPDVDALYMEATVSLTGSGGWPMTVFLTPDGSPFYAGTYFPPEPRHGMPSFPQLLHAVAEAWRTQREDVARQASRIGESLGHSARMRASTDPLSVAVLDAAESSVARAFEPAFGGFGRAPKFPPPATLEFLLRRDSAQAREMVEHTLANMAAGGMWDVIGGGFHRYSVDDRWFVPHFEKMLYDNALLAATYLHAYAAYGDERHRRVVELTLDYLLRELRVEGGGLASAQDADTSGVEGLTFTWTPEEATAAGLSHDVLFDFEHGRCIVRGSVDEETRLRVLAARALREQPFRDDKVVASWNGLALASLAEAGYRFDRPDYVDAAREIAGFLLGPLSGAGGRLRRSYRAGKTSGDGFLDDYANVAHGLIELHAATGELRWLLEARRLALLAVELFADRDHGGFFLAPEGGEQLIARTKDVDDTPVPSGNAMLAHVLLRLGRLWADDEFERLAVGVLRLAAPAFDRYATAFGWSLCALDLYLAPPKEIAIAGPASSPVARAALAPFDPRAVVAVAVEPTDAVPLLAGKTPVDGLPAVYVCERFACRAPVTDPASF
jgi:uncharacterized protein